MNKDHSFPLIQKNSNFIRQKTKDKRSNSEYFIYVEEDRCYLGNLKKEKLTFETK